MPISSTTSTTRISTSEKPRRPASGLQINLCPLFITSIAPLRGESACPAPRSHCEIERQEGPHAAVLFFDAPLFLYVPLQRALGVKRQALGKCRSGAVRLSTPGS